MKLRYMVPLLAALACTPKVQSSAPTSQGVETPKKSKSTRPSWSGNLTLEHIADDLGEQFVVDQYNGETKTVVTLLQRPPQKIQCDFNIYRAFTRLAGDIRFVADQDATGEVTIDNFYDRSLRRLAEFPVSERAIEVQQIYSPDRLEIQAGLHSEELRPTYIYEAVEQEYVLTLGVMSEAKFARYWDTKYDLESVTDDIQMLRDIGIREQDKDLYESLLAEQEELQTDYNALAAERNTTNAHNVLRMIQATRRGRIVPYTTEPENIEPLSRALKDQKVSYAIVILPMCETQ